MEFRTIVDIPGNMPKISHSEEILLMGSCFSGHIGRMLVDAKFRCDVNPFGILYNPRSIGAAIRLIREKKRYTEADLFFHDERYYSYMHHGLFAGNSVEETLDGINGSIERAHRALPRINYMFLTFGTSWVFHLKECCIELIHFRKLLNVHTEHRDFHDILKPKFLRFQDGADIFEDLFRLRQSPSFNHRPRLRN